MKIVSTNEQIEYGNEQMITIWSFHCILWNLLSSQHVSSMTVMLMLD